ncbi:hypothetical protein [Bradyrhizobium sp. Arg816]|uniref:hypothetical protein n=1 Tax=Bradyrhizobium sp. Arg816 TaxID=2998491 RepID=UPI00249E7FBB|nr:hypothetical protein [Bradyrhizobium sp. Arg816]MDI3563556.1 hypothetical protein [Bradyrhizobium sp. Arg816]
MKIDTNQAVVAYHIVDGPVTFAYPVDAQHAVSSHPNEWSSSPWSQEDAAAAREKLADDGRPVPEPEPLSPEDQAELDAYNKAVAEAAERLAAYNAKKAAEKADADQVAMDEAIVASAPPRPDPARRPFGRKGEPTPAEVKQMEKQAADKADRERIQKEKADADKSGGATMTS